MSITVYDFDKTLYDGDSSTDFYLFCLKRHRGLIRYWPVQGWGILLYVLKIYNKTKMKQKIFTFLKGLKNVEEEVKAFWLQHTDRIKNFYLLKPKVEPICIISASPEFLLLPLCQSLQIDKLIASRIHPQTGYYEGDNCFGEEKVHRFREILKQEKVSTFYSDSLSDAPMAALSEQAYYVIGEKLIPWQDYRPSFIKKCKNLFLHRDFIMFILIGCLNTFNGIWLALVYDAWLSSPELAYAAGYITSMVIAYLLNSLFTFNESLSFIKLGKYALSCIPNFIIQMTFIFLFYTLAGWPQIVAYALAAVVGVPVTYAILKAVAFAKKRRKK